MSAGLALSAVGCGTSDGPVLAPPKNPIDAIDKGIARVDLTRVHSCLNELDTVQVAVEAYKTRNDGAAPTITEDLTGERGNLSKIPTFWVVHDGTIERNLASLKTVPEADCSFHRQ